MLSPSDPELLLQLAQQDLAGDQLAAAQQKCLQVLGAHHHHPGALEILGTVLGSQARYEDAVRVFNALTLLQPAVARHWEHLGTVLRPTKRYDQALAAFDRLAKLEGILPALESAHAVAQVLRTAGRRKPEEVVVICLSGRGDKDVYEVARLRGETI